MHEFTHLPRFSVGNKDARVTPVGLLHVDFTPTSATATSLSKTVMIPGGTLGTNGDFLWIQFAGNWSSSAIQQDIILTMTSPSFQELIVCSVYPGGNQRFAAHAHIGNENNNVNSHVSIYTEGISPTHKVQQLGGSINYSADWELKIEQYLRSNGSPFSQVQWRNWLWIMLGKAP